MFIFQRNKQSLHAGRLESVRVDRYDRANPMADDQIVCYRSGQIVSGD